MHPSNTIALIVSLMHLSNTLCIYPVQLTDDHLCLGFPRTVGQAEALDRHQDIHMVINLDVPFATIVERIKVSDKTLDS